MDRPDGDLFDSLPAHQTAKRRVALRYVLRVWGCDLRRKEFGDPLDRLRRRSEVIARQDFTQGLRGG